MNIQLRKLTVNNFKGIRSLEVNFNHTTEISGKNASFKSTIADAYFWLLWGKNSEDVKDFNIKNTVDTSLNKLDHEVTGMLDVDGTEVILKRVYREKWVTKRGNPVAEFTGNETIYLYNDVPCSMSEYLSKVNAILSESIAKLITNPFAFNSLKWEQRREVLVKIAGDVSDKDLAYTDGEFTRLFNMLNGKTIAQFSAEIAAKKRPIKEILKQIPARIDESSRSKPEAADFDFIAKSIENKKKLIEKVDLAISDKVKSHREESVKIIQKQNDLNRLKMQLQELEASEKRNAQKELSEVDNKINALELDIKKSNTSIQSCNTEINFLKTKIEKLNTENAQLREQWQTANKEVMPEMAPDATICPSCKQDLPADKIEAIKADYETNWNKNKQNRLARINGQGQSNKTVIESYEAEINEYILTGQKAEQNISELKDELFNLNHERTELNKPHLLQELPAITSLKNQIATFETITPPVIDDAELKTRKTTLQNEVNELIVKLTAKEQIEKIEARIKELETQEREMAQEIADLERTEFTIDKFTRAKMDAVELRVNSMFKNTAFAMFSSQINGGYKEDCICLYKNVPWEDVNTAGKIQSGLEIIGVLSAYYNIYGPVWIDNRESCAEIPAIASQIINLTHVPGKVLTIE